MRDELAARDETTSLDDLISLSIRLDNRLHEWRRERSAPPVTQTMNPRYRGFAPSPLPQSLSSRIPPQINPSPTSTEEPMQLGRTTLSPRERRRLSGLCVYCGQDGHLLEHCPSLPKGGAHQPREEHW